jgi:hypothetical protein
MPPIGRHPVFDCLYICGHDVQGEPIWASVVCVNKVASPAAGVAPQTEPYPDCRMNAFGGTVHRESEAVSGSPQIPPADSESG